MGHVERILYLSLLAALMFKGMSRLRALELIDDLGGLPHTEAILDVARVELILLGCDNVVAGIFNDMINVFAATALEAAGYRCRKYSDDGQLVVQMPRGLVRVAVVDGALHLHVAICGSGNYETSTFPYLVR